MGFNSGFKGLIISGTVHPLRHTLSRRALGQFSLLIIWFAGKVDLSPVRNVPTGSGARLSSYNGYRCLFLGEKRPGREAGQCHVRLRDMPSLRFTII